MATTKWAIDPTHTEIQFKVKHLMITTVTGNFDAFSGEATTEGDDFEGANVNFSAQIASIRTGNEQRDGHLKSADFFDAEQFPTLGFESKTFSGGKLLGDLTMHGVTKEVALDAEFLGIAKDPWGNVKAGFELEGKIKRSDFGLTWNAPTEAGGVLVSDDVRLIASVQLVKTA
ncbi:MAG: YceI family protein [Saprospiraceae bacterium]|nr:YceI family protein [Saprospiraceae bacterium]